MIKPYQELAINNYKLSNGRLEDTRKAVIKEHSLALIVKGELWMTFICSPIQLKEQAVGFLFNEGIISGLEDIDSLQLAEDQSRIDIRLNKSVEKPDSFHRTSTGIQPVQTELSNAIAEPVSSNAGSDQTLYEFTENRSYMTLPAVSQRWSERWGLLPHHH